MEHDYNIEVVARFFSALDALKSRKVIRGYQTFCNRYGINRRNLWQLKQDKSRKIFNAGWLSILCEDYGVSPAYLLLGEGEIFG